MGRASPRSKLAMAMPPTRSAVLSGIVAVGGVLRLYRLGVQSLWIDEIHQIGTARLIDSAGFSVVALRDNVAPLSQWLLWAWIKVFGASEFAVRMPSVLAGTVVIMLVYLAGWRLFSREIGLTAAAVTAVSPFAIWYAQDARMYAILMCISTCQVLAFWWAAVERGSFTAWVTLTVTTAAGVYTHQYAVLVSGACGAYLLARVGLRGRVLWYWGATQAIAALLFVPWLLQTLNRAAAVAGSPKGGAILWVPYTLYAYLFGFSLGPSVDDLHLHQSFGTMSPHLGVILPLAVAAGYVMCCGLVRMFRLGPPEAAWFCLAWLVVPIILAIVLTRFTNVSYNVRYVSPSFPAFALLLAAGILTARRSRTALASTLLVGLGIGCALANWYFDGRYAKADYRSAAGFLAQRVAHGDKLIISSESTVAPLVFYGFDRTPDATIVAAASLDRAVKRVQETVKPPGTRVWLVEARVWESDPEGRVRRTLDEHTLLIAQHEWPGVAVHCYQSRRPSDTR